MGDLDMIIKQDFIPKNHPARPGLLLSKPTAITIHWIGPYPKQTPAAVRNWWFKGEDGKGVQASAHYVVKDDEVLQVIPEGEVAWHCGSKGNYTSIGIEVIPMNLTGEFSGRTIETLAELLTKLPPLELLRHYDWTQKDCPRFYTPVTAILDGGGRVANPEGGEARWKQLIEDLKAV